ncbi:MAG: sensor histidine kinase [Cytophagales bacterium]|nr:sensor histidine kinase [Bernardetiaceae bacterium]MDW8205891.1 sensor histidine kinase [Cytophagales bacterium]
MPVIWLLLLLNISHFCCGQQLKTNIFENEQLKTKDAVFHITRTDTVLLPGKFLYLLTDSTSQLTIQDILQPNYQAAFQRHPYDFSSQTAPQHAHWVKLSFINHTDETIWLSNQNAFVHYIDFYAADSSGQYRALYQTGIMRPDSTKAFPHSNMYWFPLPARKGKLTTVYIRMEGGTVVPYRMYAGSLTTLIGQKNISDYAFGMVVGIILVMLGYHIFLIFATRASIYITYSAYLLSCLFVVPQLMGYHEVFTFFLPASYKPLLHKYFLAWHSIIYVLVICFAIHFLKLRQRLPYFFAYLLVQLVIFGVVFPALNIIGKVYFSWLFVCYQLNILLLYVTLMLVGFYLWLYKKDSMARFYTFAWVWIVIASFLYICYLNNLLPYRLIFSFAPIWGITMEILFFSLAIGNRINLMRQENLRLVAEQNIILEKKVTERTYALSQANLALQQANEELTAVNAKLEAQSHLLEELNRTKDKLFAIIGHDLRNPINSLLGLFSLLESGVIGSEEFMAFSEKLKANVERLHVTLDNLLIWANNQLWGIKAIPQRFSLHEVATENIRLLNQMAQAKNVSIHNLVPVEAHALADVEQIKLVFRNLITNAIKFTSTGGTITITASRQERHWQTDITDTGTGIPPDKLPKLFTSEFTSTSGTNKEKGTGLGLLLCKDFVEKNGGKIGANSTEGIGSTFFFTVPAAAD